MTISVVIPTLNEAEELPATLGRLRGIPEIREVVISDGGSTDGTPVLARDAGARVIRGPPGRGGQLRRGAVESTGDVVLLLHADTWLPPDAGAAIREVLAAPGVVGGAFEKVFRNPPWITRGSRLRCRLRMRWLQFAYGDQAIFVRRQVLEACGGVPEVPLMEEYLLCAALRSQGRLALARAVVSTSARRFRRRGPLRTYLLMGLINLRWHLGASPESLSKAYQRAR